MLLGLIGQPTRLIWTPQGIRYSQEEDQNLPTPKYRWDEGHYEINNPPALLQDASMADAVTHDEGTSTKHRLYK